MADLELLLAGTLEDERKETLEMLDYFRDRLVAINRALGISSLGLRTARSGYSNLSAICIGARGGYGARHAQCNGIYHRARCTCSCHVSHS